MCRSARPLVIFGGTTTAATTNDENENHAVPVVAEKRFKALYDDEHLYIGRRAPRLWEKEEK